MLRNMVGIHVFVVAMRLGRNASGRAEVNPACDRLSALVVDNCHTHPVTAPVDHLKPGTWCLDHTFLLELTPRNRGDRLSTAAESYARRWNGGDLCIGRAIVRILLL